MINEPKQPKPRYTITTISTLDPSLFNMAQRINKQGYSHEVIYRRGLYAIQVELDEGTKSQN